MNLERYNRQITIPSFGIEGQNKLNNARVLVVGCGGLGCPVLQYLTAAGIGTIGFIDGDIVSLSNLQRQVLYTIDDLNLPKALIAFERLQRINNEVKLLPYNKMLDNEMALSVFPDYDIIVDCTDNFATRYLINDACVLLKKPLVYGAIYQFEGQVAIFGVADQNGQTTNYRDIFATPPSPQQAPDCATAGVLGVLPGIIGTIQATEVIKLITDIGQPLSNKLLNYNALNHETMVLKISENTNANILIPKDEGQFLHTNYIFLCNPKDDNITVIDSLEFEKKILARNALIIDVREIGELPKPNFEHIQIPLSTFSNTTFCFDEMEIVLFCQLGKRSIQAAELLLKTFGNTKKIYSLEGGIIKYNAK